MLFRSVLVTLAMNAAQTITHQYLPQITSGNFVTGDAKLEFVRADQAKLDSIFGDSEEIIGSPYTDGEFLKYGTKAESIFEMEKDFMAYSNLYVSIRLGQFGILLIYNGSHLLCSN